MSVSGSGIIRPGLDWLGTNVAAVCKVMGHVGCVESRAWALGMLNSPTTCLESTMTQHVSLRNLYCGGQQSLLPGLPYCNQASFRAQARMRASNK